MIGCPAERVQESEKDWKLSTKPSQAQCKAERPVGEGVEYEQAMNKGESKRLKSKWNRKRDKRAVRECRMNGSKKKERNIREGRVRYGPLQGDIERFPGCFLVDKSVIRQEKYDKS